MKKSLITDYLSANQNCDPCFIAYLASLVSLEEEAPEVADSIVRELKDQRSNLKLIASENYSSLASQLSMGNLLTDKYSEGYPMHRFYAGCDNVDDIESLAVNEACRIFNADHAYIQPHSGADANLIAYWAILATRVEEPALEEYAVKNVSELSKEDWDKLRLKIGNQKMLGLDYYSGGHLTHGYRHNVSAQMFDAYTYTVNQDTGLLDYDAIEKQALDLRPLILLAGYSAYPRKINFKRMREIADKAGAVLMVDMAHFAGLVAGGVFTGEYNPIPYAQVVTTTTHKTLRGPRGGMILCSEEFREAVDRGCPLVIGGPLPHIMAAKAVALKEAAKPGFKKYAHNIVENASALAEACRALGMNIATGGTDNHLFLIDVRNYRLTGRQAESSLRECGVTLNRNSLPFDSNGPWYTSGLRIGTPAVTTLGMNTTDMERIAAVIHYVLENTKPAVIEKGRNAGKKSRAKYILDLEIKQEARKTVSDILSEYPVYPELDLPYLEKSFLLKK